MLAMPGRVASVPIELEIAQEVKTILGDAQSVRRLVENLVSNAVRFTRQGRIRIRADLPRRGGQQWLRIRVEDTGEGMDEKTLELLGRPFLLGGAHRGSGSGLGVGICAGICAAHGGMLTVRPRQGEGTTFSAWLRTDLPGPVPTPEEPTVQIVS